MTELPAPALKVRGVTFGFPSRPDFLKPVRLEMRPGECWGIIGPNGAGKSTLLRLLAGLWTPTSGEVLFGDRPLHHTSAHRRGRHIAFMPQRIANEVSLPAGDVVLMGRFPHRRLGLFEDAADYEIARRAMRTTHTLAFAERSLSSLSVGEAQRVHIAAALAQQPSILLLDEPMASLDLHYQLSIFQILKKLAEDDGLLVVVVAHDLNLAARFCTHLVLLDDGAVVSAGRPDEVLKTEVLESVYRIRLASSIQTDAGPWIIPLASQADKLGNADAERPVDGEGTHHS